MKNQEIILPFPPSVNHYWKLISINNRASMAVDKRGKDFRNLVKYIVGKRDCLTDRLAVDILAYPPDKRRRDIDNLLKATLDALQHAGVYKDDYLIDDLRIRRKEAVKDGSLIINISEM